MHTKKIIEDNTQNEEANVTMSKQNLEKAPKFPFLLRRFFEFFLVSIICSVPVALLYQFGFPKYESWALKVMGASLVVFILLNIYLLRAFFYSMGNKKIYFNVNLTAYLLYVAVNLAVLVCFRDNHLPSLYSYMFMPMKFANVVLNMIVTTSGNIHLQLSAAGATHILMYGVIFAAPMEMYMFDKKKK